MSLRSQRLPSSTGSGHLHGLNEAAHGVLGPGPFHRVFVEKLDTPAHFRFAERAVADRLHNPRVRLLVIPRFTDSDGAQASDTHTVAAVANVDIEITSQTVGGATKAIQGQNFAATVTKVLHNNGAFAAEVSIAASATPPAGCTVVSAPEIDPPTLPTTQPVTVIETFTLNCTETGSKTFTFDNDIQTTDPHIVDLEGAQSSDSGSISIAAAPAVTPTPTPVVATPTPVVAPAVLPPTGSGPDSGPGSWIALIFGSVLLAVSTGAAAFVVLRQLALRRGR